MLYGLALLLLVCGLVATGYAGRLLWMRARTLPRLPEFLRERSDAKIDASLKHRMFPTGARSDIQALDQSALSPRGRWCRHFSGAVTGRPFLARAQAESIGPNGELLHTWGLTSGEDDPVVSWWLRMEVKGVPVGLHLHAFVEPNLQVFGDEALAMGLLSGPLSDICGPGDQLVVTDEWVGFYSPTAWERGELYKLIPALADLVRRLEEACSDDRVDRGMLLQSNLLHDPSPKVRARAVDALWQIEAKTSSKSTSSVTALQTRSLVREALSDEAAEVRFAAARNLNDLKSTRALVTARDASEGLRQRALLHLFRRADEEMVQEVIQEVLEANQLELLRLAAEELGKRGPVEGLDWLATPSPKLAVEPAFSVVSTARALGSQRAVRILMALANHQHLPVAYAAIEALGLVADISIIPQLRDLGLRRHRLVDGVRIAIAEIQARRQGGVVGGLALVDAADELGSLSLDPEAEESPSIEELVP